MKEAYKFAAENGLEREAETIRKSKLRVGSRDSAVKSGYMILLFSYFRRGDCSRNSRGPTGSVS